MAQTNYFKNKYFNLYHYDFKEKQRNANYIVEQFLDRLLTMFKYSNLPESIPQRELELCNLTVGYSGWCKVNGNLYALYGGLGGVPNEYYLPTEFILSNPILGTHNYKIDEECIIMRNDSMLQGVLPLLSKYANLSIENDITFQILTIQSRIPTLISADDDATAESARMFFKHLIGGDLDIIEGKTFTDGISAYPYNSVAHNAITDVIEGQQYIKASLYNELGLNANYNMKREAINASEATLNDSMIIPLVDNMLLERRKALGKINKMFGTNISVELSGAWKKERDKQQITLGVQENEKSE